MNEPKFTHGPWRHTEALPFLVEAHEGKKGFLHTVCQLLDGQGWSENREGNAFLIAAAPEMYHDEIMLRNELDSLFHYFEQTSLGVKFSSGEIEKRRDRIIAALNKSEETLKKARGEK